MNESKVILRHFRSMRYRAAARILAAVAFIASITLLADGRLTLAAIVLFSALGVVLAVDMHAERTDPL